MSGPVDAAKVHDEWKSGASSDYYGTLYLLDFYNIAERLGAEVLVITTLPGDRKPVTREGVTIVNHPLPESASGTFYHALMFAWALRCSATIARFRAHAVVLTAGQDYFWPFSVLRLLGTRLLVSLHCTLWPKFSSRRRHQRILDWLNGNLLYPLCDHIQANSNEARAQIRQISRRSRSSPVRYTATYDAERFLRSRKPQLPRKGSKFELLYVGRIVQNKGVVDALHVLRHLETRHPGMYKLTLCGSGPDEGLVSSVIEDLRLQEIVEARGECTAEQLHQAYATSHAVLVPTRSDFEEGQPKVAFEAVLNYRPLIMSAACPALADVREATVEARVDDVQDYVRSIETLSSDRGLYERTVAGAEMVRIKFLDPLNGYQSVLSQGLLRITAGVRPPLEL